jgi:hypothetical protein
MHRPSEEPPEKVLFLRTFVHHRPNSGRDWLHAVRFYVLVHTHLRTHKDQNQPYDQQ